MDEFQSEKEQIEEIKQWWKENGTFVVTGLLLGVLVLGGWNYWKQYRVRQAEAASATYEQLMQALQANNASGAETYAGKLTDEFSATPYASQARLALARLYVAQDDNAAAAEQLETLLRETSDESLKRIARLRLARVRLTQGQADAAIELLGRGDPGEFAALYHDARGDAHAQRGETGQARSEYQAALDKYQPGLFDRQFVEMKLADLTGADSGA